VVSMESFCKIFKLKIVKVVTKPEHSNRQKVHISYRVHQRLEMLKALDMNDLFG
jgi:hypothetical protein